MSETVDQEVDAAINTTAFIDRSFFGRIRVTGADRLDLLHRLSTNDLLLLKQHSSTGTVLTTDKGRIIDYIRIIVQPDDLILITSPGYEERVKAWIEKYTIMEDVAVSIVTGEIQMLSLLGPNAFSVARELFPKVPSENKNCVTQIQGVTLTLDNQEEFSVSCINILFPIEMSGQELKTFLERTLNKYAQLNVNAYDSFRMMKGIPGGTTELTESFNPLEVGLRHSISFTKGCYIGQEVIARLDTYQKVRRGLALLRLEQAISIWQEHLPIVRDSEEIGVLTSVATIPYQLNYHALGVIKVGKVGAGDPVVIKAQPVDVKGFVQTIFDQGPS